jgi:hypothetical protein
MEPGQNVGSRTRQNVHQSWEVRHVFSL